ncbi:MAG: cob(I)yrinic acid a,c-diamide adenosyltransferase [Proteobacteria bacterium]|nr:cob(I)yrinic acid a,c-diamide adenosyltransferase [Pseudomonadota bacterium]
MVEVKRQQEAKVRERKMKRGVLIVHEGDGKGKSTAAFGTALRAVGHGQRVGIVQFIKGNWKTGEQQLFKRLDEVDHVIAGEGFTWNTQDRKRDIEAAERGWQAAKAMIEASRSDPPRYSLIVLDELNIALGFDYLPLREVVDVLSGKPEQLSIIVTGRGAKPELVEIADTVTEMRCIKHAFDSGIRARAGVDF